MRMTLRGPTRRSCLAWGLASALALGLSAAPVRAEVIELEWSDLVPKDAGLAYEALKGIGVIEHGEMSTPFDQEAAGKVTTAYDGKRVRLPGYVVPLDFEGTKVTTFILVPYVGACIHVPPPPANQLVLVTAQTPFESEGLFDPIWVEGPFSTAASETQLAEIGYSLTAERVEPYEF